MGNRRKKIPHPVPRCLLTLHEKASGTELDGEGIQAWLEWEAEAMRWRVPVEISRADLKELVEASTGYLERECHRLLDNTHDWSRWSSRGGRETVKRYGTDWMALIALKRWGRVTAADLDRARMLR